MAERMASFKSGVIWSTINVGVSVGLPLGLFIVFARVTPAWQLGLIAVGLAWAEMLKGLAPQGLYEAFLAYREPDEPQVARGMLTILAAFGVASYIAYVLILVVYGAHSAKATGLPWPIWVIGLRAPFDLITLQPQAQIAKKLAYRRLALRTVVGNLFAGGVALIFAFAHQPLAGLAVYYVGQSACILLATVFGAKVMARPLFSIRKVHEALKPLYHQTSWASGVRTLGVANNYLDQIIISAFIPLKAVANFNLGKRIEATLMQAAASFSGIIFQPLFAHDPKNAAATMRRCMFTSVILFGPPVAVLVVNNQSLIPGVFGGKWQEAASTAAALAISGFWRGVGTVHSAYLSVSGRNRDLLFYAAGASLLGIAAVVGLHAEGVFWCAAALAGRSLVTTIWAAVLTRRLTPARYYLRAVIGAFLMFMLGAWLGAWGGSAATASLPHLIGELLTWTLSGVCSLALGALCLTPEIAQQLSNTPLLQKFAR